MTKRKKKGNTNQLASNTPKVKFSDALRSPLIRYMGIFSAIMIVFYIIWFTAFFKETIIYPWNNINAHISSFILRLFGMNTTAHDMNISDGTIAITIKEGCDAIEPVVLFTAAVLSFPASWKKKLKGIGKGVFILFAMNLVRIVSLFFIEKYWPAGFEFMHIQFWQVAFIVFAVILWVLWMRTTTESSSSVEV